MPEQTAVCRSLITRNYSANREQDSSNPFINYRSISVKYKKCNFCGGLE
jgi:hypothetical protein